VVLEDMVGIENQH